MLLVDVTMISEVYLGFLYFDDDAAEKCKQKQLPVFCKRKVFLKILQISQENNFVGVSF